MGVGLKEQKVLPENITIAQIINSLPKQVFEKDESKAIRSMFITAASVALGVYLIHISPVWLLPLLWIYTGTAGTGLFVIGHDCGHRSFMKSLFWNDFIGTIAFCPLLYPFHAWRIQHNIHHKNTNKLNADNAWHPLVGDYYLSCDPVTRFVYRIVKGPGYFIASIGHWVFMHLDLSLFKGDDLDKVKSSVTILTYFVLGFFPAMYYFVGIWGIIKLWAVPWLVFHFWMSTFTLLHHTAPHIPFLDESKWRDSVAALQYTVHCNYPAWLDFLCHDISVHIPHHVSPAIPHYRLRLAHDSIKQNWAPYIQPETTFSLQLLWDVVSTCQIYDDETSLYKTFASFMRFVGLMKPVPAAAAAKAKPKSI